MEKQSTKTTDDEDFVKSRGQGKRKIIRNKKLKDSFTIPVLSTPPSESSFDSHDLELDSVVMKPVSEGNLCFFIRPIIPL